MKKIYLLLLFTFCLLSLYSQNDKTQIDLSEFNLSNTSSPAFVLINESPSEIYVPENLKSLTIHALNNLSESLSIEVSPYYFINTKSKDRSFFKYIGLKKVGTDYKQNILSGLNTSTFSLAYANKEFTDLIEEERKVFSLGFRTKLIRVYNKNEAIEYYDKVSSILTNIVYPNNILAKIAAANTQDEKTKIINDYFKTEEGIKHLKNIEAYKKPIKPIFQIDFAMGYSSLFEEDKIDSKTLNRFGAWLTSEFSLILNKDSDESKSNNYINLFLTSRYVEDEFNLNENTLYYRDFGGKIELELGKFSLGYEYIDRNGSIDKERSVGSIKYLINKNVSLNGGFGKDFSSEDNLVTLFGINWGIDTKSD